MQHEGARPYIAVRRHHGANGRPRRRHHLSMLANAIWIAATMLTPLTGVAGRCAADVCMAVRSQSQRLVANHMLSMLTQNSSALWGGIRRIGWAIWPQGETPTRISAETGAYAQFAHLLMQPRAVSYVKDNGIVPHSNRAGRSYVW